MPSPLGRGGASRTTLHLIHRSAQIRLSTDSKYSANRAVSSLLVALGQLVEIVVRPHRGTRSAPQLRVTEEVAGPSA